MRVGLRLFLALAGVCVTSQMFAQETGGGAPPVRAAKSTSAQREDASITVYNQNFGLVREVRNMSESDWEISLRNHKDTAVDVEVYEPVGGEWEVLGESHPHTKRDAHTFTFKPHIDARKDVKLTYRVRVKWC